MLRIGSRIKRLLAKGYVGVEKLEASQEFEDFTNRFREHYISQELIRIGSSEDGGYLLPPILNSDFVCFSPGVAYNADFESDLSKLYNIKSFMADGSVDGPPFKDPNFSFIPKFLSSTSSGNTITLKDWISESECSGDTPKILQMDIEGGEYGVLCFEEAKTLSKFKIMIIEFHDLHKLFERNFLQMFSSIFDKIYENFYICHAHPNNCCGIASLNGKSTPRVMEITFIRKDCKLSSPSGNKIQLPHDLDSKNVSYNKDIIMPPAFWSS